MITDYYHLCVLLYKFLVFALLITGLYRDCKIHFEAILKDYPEKAPDVNMLDTVAHPNVQFMDDTLEMAQLPAKICLSIIDEWELGGR